MFNVQCSMFNVQCVDASMKRWYTLLRNQWYSLGRNIHNPLFLVASFYVRKWYRFGSGRKLLISGLLYAGMSGPFIPPKSTNHFRFYIIDFLFDNIPANWPTLLRRSGRVCSGLFNSSMKNGGHNNHVLKGQLTVARQFIGAKKAAVAGL